ncbi:MAG TPA: hypothetical protein VKY19_13115 [Ktedonosporobacter sp.]|jgi:hypothetical protein|nr:hypothetical protein [Ktedonosporobacter sp.]
MNILDKSELKTLMGKQNGPCVSIYIPAHHQAGVEMTQARIRYKNLLRETQNRLVAQGMDALRAEKFMQPLEALYENISFWQHPADGVAVLCSTDDFHYYSFPISFHEQVVIDSEYYLKPLLPLLADGRFYILALSQNDIRLLECTHYTINTVELPESVPESLAEALRFDEFDNELEFHSGGSDTLVGKGGRRAVIFHGQGVGPDTAKDNILRYFQQIDRGLHELLHDEKVPLILAGVEYLLPIYHEANTYPYLVKEGIAGNPDRTRASALREAAWPIAEPYIMKARQEALDYYRDHVDTDRTASNLTEIVPAAFYGRVFILFAAIDQEQWGTFDPQSYTIDLHETRQSGDNDLLYAAMLQTLLHNGTVYPIEQEKMPNAGAGLAPALLAAIYRY